MKPTMVAARKNPSGRPLTGAWIETMALWQPSHRRASRPLTGAWIETADTADDPAGTTGRPLTGAWIETELRGKTEQELRVAPSRGRGLKPPRC